MCNSKNIDRLFQEKFKDFEASPPPDLWKNIEAKLNGKNTRRKMLPIWWKAASVAAILALFFSIGLVNQSKFSDENSVSVEENNLRPLKNISGSKIEIFQNKFSFSSLEKNISNFNNKLKNIDLATIFDKSQVQNSKKSVSKRNVESNQFKEKTEPIFSLENSNYDLLPGNHLNFETSLATNTQTQKKSLVEVAAEIENLNKRKENKSENKLKNRWELQPNLAPIFMNSINGGNAVASNLNGKTSSNANVSYGVNLAFQINKRIKIRSGINQVAMGYGTNNVVVSGLFRTTQASNLSGSEIAIYGIMSQESFDQLDSNGSRGLSESGALNHELGFLEIPLEIQYNIFDKKFGLNILGGASTFLLTKNDVLLETNEGVSQLGSANNMNNTSFSANFGMGLDYNFSEKWSLNLEPKFKYQINTFEANTTEFKPYFFGIYSGVKFKF
ncbi:porin family protein [Psychroflexus aestuariivivens]|uniref:outer membrane beta-barrel protein n=1 Tax=Psychroflexus aestuariivivens TaxID=1795040 RepID=UPI000FDB4388|nr:outer membrane beta-barrel protein [Psychroflexus aestuariivivens]